MAILIPPIVVLDRALRDAGIPIEGVSIGNLNDRATWKALYQPSATGPQRTQGDALMATLDPQDVATVANCKADESISLADTDVLKAVAQALWEAIPSPLVTKVQLRARILALLRA